MSTKKFFNNNQTLLLLIGLITLILAIFIPAKIKEASREVPETVVSKAEDRVEVVAPDTRVEVQVPILMYHHIRIFDDQNDKIGYGLSVSPEKFKGQIDYLKNNGYTTITFKDFVDFPTKALPEKPIILTFDDGYADNFPAFNMLKDNDQVGVFYIINNFIGNQNQLTIEQVSAIAASKSEIGSHTLNHPDLTKISLYDAGIQISQSKNELEKKINKKIISFCYPSGGFNDAVANEVKNAGYLTAVTTKNSISNTSENKFMLHRIRMNPGDALNGFAKKISN